MSTLFIAWRSEDVAHTAWGPVGRLDFDGQVFRFCYTRGARRLGFRPFPKMDRLDQVYESTDLFPLFANRLLSQSRPEYEAYLRWGVVGAAAPDLSEHSTTTIRNLNSRYLAI